MDKKEFKESLKAQLIESLEADLRLLISAAVEAREAATHEESKAEDKYDTRGLEASYLAGAQAKRAAELGDQIQMFRMMPLREFNPNSTVGVSALVEVESLGKRSSLFVVPKGGGNVLEFQGRRVQVITPVSSLGEELMGRKFGEEFEVEIAGVLRTYRVLDLS